MTARANASGCSDPALDYREDSTPPDSTIDSGPSATTDDPTPAFTFSASEAGATFQCRVDGAAFGACSGPGNSHTTASLADGAHTFEVRATDEALAGAAVRGLVPLTLSCERARRGTAATTREFLLRAGFWMPEERLELPTRGL